MKYLHTNYDLFRYMKLSFRRLTHPLGRICLPSYRTVKVGGHRESICAHECLIDFCGAS